MKKILICLGVGVLLSGLYGNNIYAKTQESMEQEEAASQVYAYFTAISDGDTREAEELRGEPNENVDVMVEANQECGVEEYENIQVSVYPMERENTWLAAVSYELCVCGIDENLPGYEVLLAEQKPGGDWHLIIFESDAEMEGEVTEMMIAEGIWDEMLLCDEAYDAIAQENPRVTEWIEAYTDAVYEIYLEKAEEETEPFDTPEENLQEELENRRPVKRNIESYVPREKNA